MDKINPNTINYQAKAMAAFAAIGPSSSGITHKALEGLTQGDPAKVFERWVQDHAPQGVYHIDRSFGKVPTVGLEPDPEIAELLRNSVKIIRL